MSPITKKFKGKTLKVFLHQEKGDFWAGEIYCPWCSELKRVSNGASPRRAAQKAFDAIEAHWKIAHEK